MEGLKDKTADLISHVEDIADTYYKLTLVNVTQKTSNVASSFLVMAAVCILGTIVVLFGGIALSLWLGDLMNSRAGGFLVGAGIFLVVLTTIILLRKKIIFPMIRDRIIKNLYD